jgi:uncharacterized phage infection (PIP) family protein YhgE
MVTQQFVGILPWALLVALVVAIIGLAIPKLWVLNVASDVWVWSWLGGSVAVGLLFAIIETYFTRRAPMDAAIEIDRRFGLKERVSSALSLDPEETETEAGQALVSDAVRRVGALEVNEKFGVTANWRVLLPVLPALIALAIVLVPDAQDKAKAASSVDAKTKEQIKRSAQALKARLAKKRESIEQSGLKDAEEIFKKLHQGIDELSKNGELGRKQALVKINDLQKQLDERRKALGDPEKMQKQFEGLKDLSRGPADKLAKAMKESNFNEAMKQLEQMKDKLKSGDLSEEEQKQLAKQLQQMKGKMEEMVNAQEDAKRQLEQQIREKVAQGDLEGAGELQRKLDKLQQQDRQMEQLQEMASKLGKASEALENGDSQTAQAELSEFSDQLDQMQSEMDQLQSLDEIMDEIASAKDSMNCEECAGAG